MKLVRDRIPQIIEESGSKCNHRIATLSEFKKYLYLKMDEELQEFIENPSDEEAGDMLEVLRAIAWAHNIPFEKIIAKAEEKRIQRGGFNLGIILESVD
jgi:predicted house-cleaning noncanonical NTP pyrophosphatase (MazG superfamily)